MIRNYLIIALRTIRRNTSYTMINVLGLSLGIACSLIIFMLVKHHLSFDTFHADTDRIYRIVTEQHRDQVTYEQSVPAPLGKVFREDYTFAEQVARICTFDERQITITRNGQEDKFREPEIAFVETAFFDIFNYPLVQGTMPAALTEPNTAVITERIAKKYFGDENPVGQTIRFQNLLDFTITGVLKDFPTNTDRQTQIYFSYVTLPLYDDWLGSDDSWGGIHSAMKCFVKLKPGVTVAQVEAVLPDYVKKFRPTSKNVHHYKLQPMEEVHFDGRYGGAMEKRNLWVLACIGIFLIVTACVNFVNLATAQAINRSKEVGVRKSLGGRRFQFFWQFISETAIITVVAITLALVFSYTVLPVVNTLFGVQLTTAMFGDVQLVLFIVGLAVLVTFLSGSYPGLILSGFQPVIALKGKLTELKTGGFNTRRSLVVMQFVISQVLIIGLIVVVSQLRYAQESDLGFRKDAIVMVPLGSVDNKINTLKTQVAALPGVEDATLCTTSPASGSNWSTSLRYDNRVEDEAFSVIYRGGDEEYLKTFDLDLVAGRNLSPPVHVDSIREFLVNETFVAKLGLSSPDEILGHTIAVNGGSWKAPVVGVVKDFHDQSFHENVHPVFMTTQSYDYLAVRVQPARMQETLKAVEKEWSAIYPEQIYEHRFLDDDIKEFYETEATMLNLVQVFAGIAIFIGCMGLYGLMSFMAVQKTKEIGIRKVLGGSIAHILWLFGKEFVLLIVLAFAVAAPVSWWLMSAWLKDFQFKISLGPWIFGIAILSTALIALLTVSWQSWRAASVNPAKSLRSE
jgi:predicted permease